MHEKLCAEKGTLGTKTQPMTISWFPTRPGILAYAHSSPCAVMAGASSVSVPEVLPVSLIVLVYNTQSVHNVGPGDGLGGWLAGKA